MTVRYTCPMHPEVQADKPGRCPKCGMKLVKRDETQHEMDSCWEGNAKARVAAMETEETKSVSWWERIFEKREKETHIHGKNSHDCCH